MESTNANPLVVYVLDAADLNLLQKWMAEDRLPNLAALWRASRVNQIGGPGYWDETGSWISAFSGVPPTHHGYYSARRLKRNSYSLEIVSLSDAKAQLFWGLVEDPHFRALILEPVEGFPSPKVAGAQLYNLTAHQEAYAIQKMVTIPESLGTEITRIYGRRRIMPFDRFNASPGYYRRQLAANLDVLRRKGHLYRELIRSHESRLIVIGFNELHDCVHLFWPFQEGMPSEQDPGGELANAVRTFYEEVNREIGRIQEILPKQSVTCLLSMYGIKNQYPTQELSEHLMELLGHQVVANSSATSSGPIDFARQIIPEGIRFELSKHLPNRLQQRLLCDHFAHNIDFRRSRAFVLPTSLFSTHVRVNLKGREPNGIVSPGPVYEALLDEIEYEFRQLIDPRTGQPAVSNVMRTANVYIDGPSEYLPDLFIHWKSSRHFIDRAIHPKGEVRQRRPGFFRDSYHSMPGFAALSGPGISPSQEIQNCSILDVAPTMLDLLGQEAPDWMPGRSLFASPRTA